jgi:hypothetical protein
MQGSLSSKTRVMQLQCNYRHFRKLLAELDKRKGEREGEMDMEEYTCPVQAIIRKMTIQSRSPFIMDNFPAREGVYESKRPP